MCNIEQANFVVSGNSVGWRSYRTALFDLFIQSALTIIEPICMLCYLYGNLPLMFVYDRAKEREAAKPEREAALQAEKRELQAQETAKQAREAAKQAEERELQARKREAPTTFHDFIVACHQSASVPLQIETNTAIVTQVTND